MTDQIPQAPWSGSDYARHSGHHRTADDWFLDRHPPGDTDVIVDVGCGSGEFTARLASLVPNGHVTGIDRDTSMLEAARRHVAANLEFIQAPAENLDEVIGAASADMVVSRAMLHWLPPPLRPRLFQATFRVLRPGGWLHLESAGTGNIARINQMLDEVAERHGVPKTPPFPETSLVFEQVEAAGFEMPAEGVRTVAQRRPFTRKRILDFLRTQGTLILTGHAQGDAAEAIVADAMASADQLRRHDGSFDQTFVRLEVLARRPA